MRRQPGGLAGLPATVVLVRQTHAPDSATRCARHGCGETWPQSGHKRAGRRLAPPAGMHDRPNAAVIVHTRTCERRKHKPASSSWMLRRAASGSLPRSGSSGYSTGLRGSPGNALRSPVVNVTSVRVSHAAAPDRRWPCAGWGDAMTRWPATHGQPPRSGAVRKVTKRNGAPPCHLLDVLTRSFARWGVAKW